MIGTDISEGVDEEGNPVWNAASVKIDGTGLDIKFQQTTEEINSLSGKIDSVRIVGKNCFTKNEGGVLEPESIVLRAETKNNATVNRWLIDDVEVTGDRRERNQSVGRHWSHDVNYPPRLYGNKAIHHGNS